MNPSLISPAADLVLRRDERGASPSHPAFPDRRARVSARGGSPRVSRAFTLIEMLVVISIIAILAGILLPTVGRAKLNAQVRKAHAEIKLLEQAIISYHSTYSRYPVSSAVMGYATTNNSDEDYTYGGTIATGSTPMDLRDYASNTLNTNANGEVIAILMDLEYYPNGSPTLNRGHVKNPQQIKFLTAKMSGAAPVSPGQPGVDLAGVYRDPWGNPYVISLDLNYDERCWDSLYRRRLVSQVIGGKPEGLEGLFNQKDKDASGNLTGGGDNYAHNGGVMVWSAGPDRKFSFVGNPKEPPPVGSANAEPNKDNVCSWK